MDRARKREDSDEPPVDKRACNLPATAITAPATAVVRDCEMEESSSSGRSDHVGESNYGSCDSDEEDDNVEDDYSGEPLPRYSLGKGRLQSVCAGLVDEKASVSAKVAALTELCEVLSFCMEDSIGYFPADMMVSVLVRLAGDESSPEVMLLSIRAITYLCDAMPRMSGTLVKLNGLPVLCNKLLSIDYLDVAEQSLQALEKISRRQQVPCLQAGTVNAVLCYIDFFSTSLQRVAVSIVSNLCKKVPAHCSSVVMESVTTLCNILQYDDKKLVETVVVCLTRIVDSFIRSTELLDEICKYGIIEKSLDLISNSNRISLCPSISTGLIGLLTKLAHSSLIAVKTLFELNVSRTVRIILLSPDVSHGSSYASLEDAQSNQVHEAFKLLSQLIPPMENDSQHIQAAAAAKEKILLDQPTFLYQLLLEIVPVSVQVVNSGANAYVSYCCVSVIKDLVYLSKSEMLIELMKNTNISSFLSGMLSRRDHHILISTLKTVEVLMQKLPDVCLNSFVKEGVVFAVDAFSSRGNSLDSAHLQSSNMPSDKVLQDRTRCLCYAFDSYHHPSSETKACKLGKDNIYSLARHINTVYFKNETISSETSLTESMKHLKTFCSKLNDNADGSAAHYEEFLTHILGKVTNELHGGESMSTFEFMESGVVRSLAQYFSNNNYLIGTSSALTLSNNFVDIIRRCQVFARLCFSHQGESWENALLSLLVRKLQKALSSLDTFPVIISPGYKPRNTYTDVPVRRATMNPCLKVRILRDKDEANSLDFDSIVSIDITLTLATIEEYVWLKVQKNQSDSQRESSQMIDIKERDSASASTSGSSSTNAQESSSAVSLEVNRSHILQSLVEDSYNSSSAAASCISTAICSQITEGGDQKLTFYLCGKPLDRSITLYEAVLESQIAADCDIIVGPKLWSELYQLTFRSTVDPGLIDNQNKQGDCGASHIQNQIPFPWQNLSSFSSMFNAELPCKLSKSNPSYDILFLLKCLDGLNHYSFHLLTDERSNAFAEGRIDSIDDLKVTVSSIPNSEFMSCKLTDKLEQQLRDPLVLSTGCMPSWCNYIVSSCPFLFSFETRWKYFQLVTFAPSAMLQYLVRHYIDSGGNDHSERRSSSGIFSRKKFIVSRDRVLESAFEMMELHAQSKGVLEVEYNEEVGTGLGPTMEFYTLVSREFQKVGLGMWRHDKRADEAVDSGCISSPLGLFPRPWSLLSSSMSAGVQFSEVEKNFCLLGKLVAKAIKDGRILDMPFSKAFYKLILGQELGIYDIQSFDPELGRALLEFQALVHRKKHLQALSEKNCEDTSSIVYRNTRVDDLCLDFTLPGYSEYALTSETDGMAMVSTDNLEEYVALVVDATIKSGIAKQVEAFKSGFNEVFPLKSLQIFTEGELEKLLCGEQHTWSFTELVDHIKFDHGYTSNSPTVINLLEVIQEFEFDQRRAFLQFVTGAPRLPPGGLAALNPKLTVVRKLNGSDVDMDLPSVMTCANYLKLPPYSTKERMREKLLYAITEGQGSFHLS